MTTAKPKARAKKKPTARRSAANRRTVWGGVELDEETSELFTFLECEIGEHVPDLKQSLDTGVLLIFCQSFVAWQRAERDVSENGHAFVTETGYEAPRPIVKVLETNKAMCLKVLPQLGLSPKARRQMGESMKGAAKVPEGWE